MDIVEKKDRKILVRLVGDRKWEEIIKNINKPGMVYNTEEIRIIERVTLCYKDEHPL